MKKGAGKGAGSQEDGCRYKQPNIHLVYGIYWVYISPFKGLLGGVKQLGYHPKGIFIFPMIQMSNHQNPYDIPLC